VESGAWRAARGGVGAEEDLVRENGWLVREAQVAIRAARCEGLSSWTLGSWP
jgi:hypothetical protein